MNWQTVLCLGDSITIGSRSYLGYPEVLGSILNDRLDNHWNIVNHAVSGYSCIDLTRSIDKNYQNLMIQRPGVVTVMIGTNDVKNPTSLSDFKIAYEQVIIKARLLAENGNVVLISIPPIFKNALYPYKEEDNVLIGQFNATIEALKEKHQCRILKPTFSESDFFDGVHLNDHGIWNLGKQIASLILKDKGYADPSDLQ